MISLPAQRQGQINQTELVSKSLPTQRVAEFAQTRIKLKREMNPIVKVENDIILENTVELTKHLVFCKIKEYENQMKAIKEKIEFESLSKTFVSRTYNFFMPVIIILCLNNKVSSL